MSERITATQFNAGGGVDDWRVVFDGACTIYRTGSFAKGVALVDAVGALADAADHHPDIELHYGSVAIRLITHDAGWITDPRPRPRQADLHGRRRPRHRSRPGCGPDDSAHH